MMTFGAWRRVFFSAISQLSVSTPISRWVTMDFFVLVDEFDRVLDGDDVTLAVAVAVVDQRCQRGGLAGAGTADKNDQAAQGHRDVPSAPVAS
jgi:hypothetical protein